MNYILLFFIIVSIIGGIVGGLNQIQEVRRNPSLGIKQSKNIFTYLFID
jgi:hypothetical protein